MSARKRILQCRPGVLTGLCALAAQLAFAASPASAVTVYGEPTIFGSAGSGNGQFNEPGGVAVNDATGNVYVYDAGNRRVERFNATGGKFEGQFNGAGAPSGAFTAPSSVPGAGTLFNLAIDNSASPSKEDVYVVDPGHNVLDKFSATGTYLSQLTGFAKPIFGVAVDASGNVWVEEENEEVNGSNVARVQEFDSSVTNSHVTTLALAGKRSPGIAVDSQQNLYLVSEGEVPKFDHAGSQLAGNTANCECAVAVALDALAGNNLFIDEESSLVEYGPFGEPYQAPQNRIEGISGSRAVAVNGATHTVYETQQAADTVASFKQVLLPDVTTGHASEVQQTTAKLEGEVNPDGQEVTTCEFEYGTSEGYGERAPCETMPGSGSSFVPVSAQVANLTPGATYHFRLVANNGNRAQPNAGVDETFTTSPAVQGLQTLAATNQAATEATLNGSFETTGLDTHYFFEYGETSGYGSDTALTDGGSGPGVTAVSVGVNGLVPHQEYHYRIVAKNSLGETADGDMTFETAVIAPQIVGAPSAESITDQTVVLNASVNPEHTSTRYKFEYGPCVSLAACATVHSTQVETSSAYGAVKASSELVELSPSATYSYRLVADNTFEENGKTLGGVTNGGEGVFTTAPAPVPAVQTGGNAVLGATSATIGGIVNPNGVPTSYAFELGVYNGAATQYGVISTGSAGAGPEPVSVSATVTGLHPGVTYAYRLTITSGYILGESHSLQGATVTFTTPGLPAALGAPPLLAQLPIPNIPFPNAIKPPHKHKKKHAAKHRHKKKRKKKKK